MQAVTKSIRKAKRRRRITSLKKCKQKTHRRNRRRAKQVLKHQGDLRGFEPRVLTDWDLT